MARATTGAAANPRRATIASAPLVTTARPSVDHPTGVSKSPWTAASNVAATNQ